MAWKEPIKPTEPELPLPANSYGVTRFYDEETPPTRVFEQVESVPLAIAVRKQKPSPWTKNMFHLYLCLAVAACASCANGYNGSIMGNINGYKQYREYFNFDPENGAPGNGLPFAIGPLGNLIGALFAGPVNDLKGRKWGMFSGALILCIFAIVQATSQNLAQFMAARFMLGFGSAIAFTGGAIYTVEMSPPHLRGHLTGLFNCYYYIGSMPGTWVCLSRVCS